MKAVLYFLEFNNGFIPPPSVNSKPLTIKKFLGSGVSCRAFAAVYDGQDVVAKLFSDERKVAYEQANLEFIKGMQSGKAIVPTFIASEKPWMIVTPLGQHFQQPIDFDAAKDLINLLRKLHTEKKKAHWDVRYSNIFRLKDNRVLLNDWGSAVDLGTGALIQGCPDPFRHPDLAAAAKHHLPIAIPSGAHDLYSLVESIRLKAGISESNETYKEVLSAAKSENYDGCIKALRNLIC